jgi:hypothetical protein
VLGLAAIALMALILLGWKKLAASKAGAGQNWSPVVMMGGEIFPSYLVASATMKPEYLPKLNPTNALGDINGVIGISIVCPADNTKVKVTIEANTILQTSSVEVSLPVRGETYLVLPKINYVFESLLHAKQAMPLALVVDVSLNGTEPEQKSITVRQNSVNDCPFLVTRDANDNVGIPMEWMFAAYVNENHPWSEEVRKEALKSGAVDSFSGYQVPPDGVVNQVFAIWHVFQKRGFKYSDITSSSSGNGLVALQQVRFVDQCIQSSQANCADGSVLFASVLRQIGIEPVLVEVPGHMFVGFYTTDDLNPAGIHFLETTMMGNVDLSQPQNPAVVTSQAAAGVKSKRSHAFAGMAALKQKVDALATTDDTLTTSYNSFTNAAQVAEGEFAEWQAKSKATIISIQDARKKGVMPIAFEPR